MEIGGGCECGAVSYTLSPGSVLHVYACHCLNCQTRSGSAFGEHAMLPSEQMKVVGDVVVSARTANGISFEEVFCAACYTRLYNRNSQLRDYVFLRAGTLAGSERLQPIVHLWIKRKQPWVAIPTGTATFEESPTADQFAAIVNDLRRLPR